LHDRDFFEHIIEVLRPAFVENFGVEIPPAPGKGWADAKSIVDFGNAKLTYHHYTGHVDPYCGGYAWTIQVQAENFVSLSSSDRFDLDLWIVDIAWAHTEADLRMTGPENLVRQISGQLEPFLCTAFGTDSDGLFPNYSYL
jgi:hypothetical protein